MICVVIKREYFGPKHSRCYVVCCLELDGVHDEGVSRNLNGHLLGSLDGLLLRIDRMVVVVVLGIEGTGEGGLDSVGLNREAREVEVGRGSVVGHVGNLDVELVLLDVEDYRLTQQVVLELVLAVSKLDTIALVVLTA